MAEYPYGGSVTRRKKMEKRKLELTDEMLSAVTGGTGFAEDIPAAAAAEGLTIGTKLIDKYPCDQCGHIGSTVVHLWSDYMSVECDKCKIWGIYGYGGYGYTKA